MQAKLNGALGEALEGGHRRAGADDRRSGRGRGDCARVAARRPELARDHVADAGGDRSRSGASARRCARSMSVPARCSIRTMQPRRSRPGARFIVSPGMTPRLLEAAETWPIPYLPGAATASEAMALADLGYRVLKFFPAVPAGGAAYLKALAAPLPRRHVLPDRRHRCRQMPPTSWRCRNVAAVGGSWVAPAKEVRGQGLAGRQCAGASGGHVCASRIEQWRLVASFGTIAPRWRMTMPASALPARTARLDWTGRGGARRGMRH